MKTLLFKPFEKYSEQKLLIIGILSLIVGTYLASILNTRFDGAIDMHLVQSTTLIRVIKDVLISVSSLLLCLFIVGKIINSKTRFVDIFSTIVIARIPFYLFLLFNINNFFSGYTQQVLEILKSEKPTSIDPEALTFVSIIGVLATACLIWFFILLWNGFKIATNAKEKKPVWLFVVGILVAEIISKVLLAYL